MVNYQNGKIYKITNSNTNDIYVGSTTDDLSKRLHQHKIATAFCSSKNILNGNDVKIELIALYPCNSKEELTLEEAKYIRELECVNINIPHRSVKERNSKYYQDNKEEITKKNKIYVENNLEKTKQYRQEYRDNHKEEAKNYNETYRTENREELFKKKKEYYEKTKGEKAVCDICGKEMLKRSILRHKKRNHTELN